jgi:hypothetical protein
MQQAGCIAVSGGLEVASDRLLKLIKKGVTIKQVTEVTHHFKQANILVHAYLMYGFPTQTAQETIDSLEVVRQLFEAQIVQSGFWHQFSMTAHSPVGMAPQDFKVSNSFPELNAFANNDLIHEDPTGANHSKFSAGLKSSLFNYMNNAGFDLPLKEWFDFNIPLTTISPDLISGFINQASFTELPLKKKMHNLGILVAETHVSGKKMKINFVTPTQQHTLRFDLKIGNWLIELLDKIQTEPQTLNEIKSDFEEKTNSIFILFWSSPEMQWLQTNGLISV